MIYEIKTYDLTNKKIRLVKKRPDLKVVNGTNNQRDRFVDDDGRDGICGPRSKFTTSLVKSENTFTDEECPKFLPYFADVTQDLPGSCKFEPEIYENCQLMTETNGTYLQFFNHDTDKVLKIAINSNIYSPLKNN
jgi:hypothetical protein